MESNTSTSHEVSPPLSIRGERSDEDSRRALRERASQARAATADAIARYAILLAQTEDRLNRAEHNRVAFFDTREMLHDSVQRYAILLKALDTPPERMLRSVKEALVEQIPHPEREHETLALQERLVTWCIEAYYSHSPAA